MPRVQVNKQFKVGDILTHDDGVTEWLVKRIEGNKMFLYGITVATGEPREDFHNGSWEAPFNFVAIGDYSPFVFLRKSTIIRYRRKK